MEGSKSVLDRGFVVTGAARELAATIDVDAYAEGVTRAIEAEVWHYLDDPSFREVLAISVRDNVRMIFATIMGDVALDEASADGALAFAETAAQLNVPASEVERAYRIGQAFFWQGFFELAVAWSHEHDVPLEDLIGGPSTMLFRYIDHILSPVVTTYDNTRADLHKTRGQLRRLTVMQVLDGTHEESTQELERILDYPLNDTHIALLLSSERGGEAEPETQALRHAVDAEASLTFQHGPRSWIVWLARRSGYDDRRLNKLRRALMDGPFRAAVGEPAAGLDGLRLTRDQAIETARVQRALGYADYRHMWASDVRLEALLLHDEERARRFVAEELGSLAAADALARRLRETLLAWLATGSHVSAAAILGVHENTVRNRIRHAEELLGSPLLPRRTELQVALRLERVLDASAESV